MRRGFAPSTGAAAQPLVRFDAVSRRFGDIVALDRLSLEIYQSEFFALLGPSGCGKTTLLRMLAGFERPDAGRVMLEGSDIAATPPHRRPVNMMFQNYALFPHLSVAGNVGFGLRQEGRPKSEIAARVDELLALVKLEGLAGRRPAQLSGGQRQRVALARSLAKRPKVLLLDEPMAALDRKLREETQFELMELQARLGVTFVIVTHDQQEAMTVAHRMAVMNRGQIVQVGTPSEIYEQPRSRWVAEFIGDINLIEGTVVEAAPTGVVVADHNGRLHRCDGVDSGTHAIAGGSVVIGLRPEKLRIETAPMTDAINVAAGRVSDVGYLGGISIYKVRLDDGRVMKATVANMARAGVPPISGGDEVWLAWNPAAAVVLPG